MNVLSDEMLPRLHWPQVLRQSLDDSMTLSAFGGLVSYLKSLLIDKTLLSQGQ